MTIERIWAIHRKTTRAFDRIAGKCRVAADRGDEASTAGYRARLDILQHRLEALALICRGINLAMGVGVGPERFNRDRLIRALDRQAAVAAR